MLRSPRILAEVLLLVSIFGVLCFPLIFSDRSSNYSQDESGYHLPAARQIEGHWPALDLSRDSLSATAPGYHYFLATAAQLTGSGTRTLRLINWIVSSLVLVILYAHLRVTHCTVDAGLMIFPLLVSNFFVKSASWLVTDNASLLLIAGCLLSSLPRDGRIGKSVLQTLVGGIAVFVRQMALWVVALPFAAAWVAPTAERPKRLRNACIAACGPVLVAVLLFYSWGGPVPPNWRGTAVHVSTTGPVYLLCVFGIFACVYLSPKFCDLYSPSNRKVLAWFAIAGLLLFFTATTVPDHAAGRWGGYLWNMSVWFPAIAGRSLLFLILSLLGGTMVGYLWLLLRSRKQSQAASIFLVGFVAWMSTFLVNRQVFHRYFEPTIFIWLLLLVPLCSARLSRAQRAALFLCGCLQLIVTVATAHRAVLSG